MTIVPATLRINFLVKLKNLNPVNAIVSFETSSLKRLTSKHQSSFETVLNTSKGTFDSSLIDAAYKDTANVRPIK